MKNSEWVTQQSINSFFKHRFVWIEKKFIKIFGSDRSKILCLICGMLFDVKTNRRISYLEHAYTYVCEIIDSDASFITN